MYLNNNTTQLNDKIEYQKLNEKRRQLIENCKHIRSIFEVEFHPHDESSSSYLAMNGAHMNRKQHSIQFNSNNNGLKDSKKKVQKSIFFQF